MKLFEIGELPKKAGVAKLKFNNNGTTPEIPYRRGSTIKLPGNSEVEYFSLMDGVQFLLRSTDKNKKPLFWFGGTDEQPFLVRLRQEPFLSFMNRGEEGLFNDLKPHVIKKLEKELKWSTKRQGDIFAIKLPYTWDDLKRNSLIFSDRAVEAVEQKKINVFDTRHNLNGLISRVSFYSSKYFIGEGVLSAPDHAPLKIEGPHLLAQTQGLYDPQNAD